MFNKTNKKLLKKLGGRKALASLLMCLWVMIILVIPFFIITAMTVKEADNLIKEFQNKNITINLESIQNLPILQSFDFKKFFSSEGNFDQLAKSAQSVTNYLFSTIKAIYTGTTNFIFILVVCFFALYYFFKDGDLIIKKIMDLSPLPSSQEKEIFEKFNIMTVATIKGTLVIALIQGLLMGITFWIAGVQAPTIWGLVTALVSIIPLLGVFLIWLPAGIILLFMGNIWQAILVMAAGGIIISSIDNFLRPKLIEGETSLHPLLVFLATLGGIAVFGPLGFVIGPVIITLLIALLEIYQTGHISQENPAKIKNKPPHSS
jgi:predicted PurR-regulated permease PerM